jgi:predicted DsbA family dithiol-disulfide isomerase
MKDQPLIVEYYTDVLCVWAWIAQRRIDEINAQSGAEIVFQHRYIDLFGDTVTRIQEQWADKGLYDGFCDHVCSVAAPYSSAPVNSNVWRKTRPSTSTNAHLVIKAVELAEGEQAAIRFALSLRKAFFIDAQDIGNLEILFELVKQQKFEFEPVNQAINNGQAIASLMADYRKGKLQGIKGSPSYVIDGGRQILYGNIGYRVLHANISELLKNPSDEASWC